MYLCTLMNNEASGSSSHRSQKKNIQKVWNLSSYKRKWRTSILKILKIWKFKNFKIWGLGMRTDIRTDNRRFINILWSDWEDTAESFWIKTKIKSMKSIRWCYEMTCRCRVISWQNGRKRRKHLPCIKDYVKNFLVSFIYKI